jgi:hypothetical protein
LPKIIPHGSPASHAPETVDRALQRRGGASSRGESERRFRSNPGESVCLDPVQSPAIVFGVFLDGVGSKEAIRVEGRQAQAAELLGKQARASAEGEIDFRRDLRSLCASHWVPRAVACRARRGTSRRPRTAEVRLTELGPPPAGRRRVAPSNARRHQAPAADDQRPRRVGVPSTGGAKSGAASCRRGSQRRAQQTGANSKARRNAGFGCRMRRHARETNGR